MTVERLDLVLLVGAAVVLVAVAAVRLSSRSGLPSLLLYLALGLLLGEDVGGIRFDDAALTQVLGYVALVLILAEGGLSTRWSSIRPVVAPAAVLATLGTAVSVLVTAAAARVLLSVDWTTALLVGAVLASTDAAAVFSVLRRVPIPRRLAGMLEAESGFNDAPVVILVVALSAAAADGAELDAWHLAAEAALELAIGLLVGLAVGALGALGLRRVALPSAGLYPIAVLALAFAAYAAAAVAHGSGFLATYVASLALGNARLPHRAAVRGFAEAVGWMAQIGLFVLLGLLATPSRLGDQVPAALAVGLVLLLVARPLSVWLSVRWFRVPLRQQAFLSWAGLRGAVPIVLATVPLVEGVEGALEVFDLVFVLVVVFVLVQAPSLPWVARRLGVGGDVAAVDLDVESSPLGAIGADVVQVRVGPASRLHGVEVFELRLPEGANVALVVRDGRTFVPEPRTPLRHGDDVLVVATAEVREQVERRLREVSRQGRLAGWDGGRRSGGRPGGGRPAGGRRSGGPPAGRRGPGGRPAAASGDEGAASGEPSAARTPVPALARVRGWAAALLAEDGAGRGGAAGPGRPG